MNIDGIVADIDSKDIVSKRTGRAYKIWSVTLEDGTEVKMGFDKPKFNVGHRLVGQAVANKFGDMEFKPGAAPAGGSSTGGSRPAAAAAGRRFPVDITSPEISIIRQNALTNANAAVRSYHDLTPAEVTTLEGYVNLVIETAYKFADFSSGQREVKRVKEMTED